MTGDATDLCGSGVVILPDLDPTTTSTPRLISLGGKQGNGYLVNRDNMPGGLDQRPLCSSSALTDGSLWDPNAPRPYLDNNPGPLNIFGPYSEIHAQGDQAKARSTPSYFLASDGTSYLFFTGSTNSPMGQASRSPRPWREFKSSRPPIRRPSFRLMPMRTRLS
jgi:hypothetical protein